MYHDLEWRKKIASKYLIFMWTRLTTFGEPYCAEIACNVIFRPCINFFFSKKNVIQIVHVFFHYRLYFRDEIWSDVRWHRFDGLEQNENWGQIAYLEVTSGKLHINLCVKRSFCTLKLNLRQISSYIWNLLWNALFLYWKFVAKSTLPIIKCNI